MEEKSQDQAVLENTSRSPTAWAKSTLEYEDYTSNLSSYVRVVSIVRPWIYDDVPASSSSCVWTRSGVLLVRGGVLSWYPSKDFRKLLSCWYRGNHVLAARAFSISMCLVLLMESFLEMALVVGELVVRWGQGNLRQEMKNRGSSRLWHEGTDGMALPHCRIGAFGCPLRLANAPQRFESRSSLCCAVF